MKLLKYTPVYSLLFIMLLAGCARHVSTISKDDIRISSYAPVQPVLKGMANNPLLRVTIYVPAGKAEVNYSNIHCTLNQDGVDAMENLVVYYTGSEPLFATRNQLASITPSGRNIDIPVELKLKPGMHYLWFSGSLKSSATVDQKVEMHVVRINDMGGKTENVSETSSTYTKPVGIVVRKQGDDGVHSYRIPGITTTDRGTLIAVYDIRYTGSGDLPGNIDVGISRSTDGGTSWQPMKVIMDMGAPHENNGVGDPAILFDPATKKIWVTALWSKGNRSIAGSRPGLSPDETGQFAMVSSADDGLTWSAPYSITSQVKNPAWNLFFNGPGNGIVMKNGDLVFAAQYWDGKAMPHSNIIYSSDHGQTWKSTDGPRSNTTESQVIETTPGTLMLNMRDNRGSFRSVATTTDYGKSWVEHHTSFNALVDPVCMAGFVKLGVNVKGRMQEVVFFSNPATQNGRYNMTVKASLDLAETWKPENQLLYDERRGFGYSAITGIDNNSIGILYEGSRDLYFVKIPVRDIVK